MNKPLCPRYEHCDEGEPCPQKKTRLKIYSCPYERGKDAKSKANIK
jgi:hypothetical protein